VAQCCAREATQQRIQEFVARALALLEQERQTEVDAAGLPHRGASPEAAVPGPGGAVPGAGQELLQKSARKLLQLPQLRGLLGQQRSTAAAAPAVVEAEQDVFEGRWRLKPGAGLCSPQGRCGSELKSR